MHFALERALVAGMLLPASPFLLAAVDESPSTTERCVPFNSSWKSEQTPLSELLLNGKELRRAIDARYKELRESNQIKPVGKGPNSISDVFFSFLPLGISFDEADATLAAAGFSLGRKEKSNIYPYQPQQVAKIDHYEPKLLGKISVYVLLEPQDPSTWHCVGKLTAAINDESL